MTRLFACFLSGSFFLIAFGQLVAQNPVAVPAARSNGANNSQPAPETKIAPAPKPLPKIPPEKLEVIKERYPDGSIRIRFRPLDPVETPPAMDALEEGCRRATEESQLEPLIVIPLTILDFLCIHRLVAAKSTPVIRHTLPAGTKMMSRPRQATMNRHHAA